MNTHIANKKAVMQDSTVICSFLFATKKERHKIKNNLMKIRQILKSVWYLQVLQADLSEFIFKQKLSKSKHFWDFQRFVNERVVSWSKFGTIAKNTPNNFLRFFLIHNKLFELSSYHIIQLILVLDTKLSIAEVFFRKQKYLVVRVPISRYLA